MSTTGYFIAIEGGDGSGKGTHAELLREHFVSLGRDVKKVGFPQHGKPSAEIVKNYLNGDYGEVNTVSADLASLPYALDRYAAKAELLEHLDKNKSLAITDRYTGSNLAHQGTKFMTTADRHAFYKRMSDIEYRLLGIPRPDIHIVLLMPTRHAQANIDKKDSASRSYTTKQRDIHEADTTHLEMAKANYEELCKLYPHEYIPVECMDDMGTMRSIEDIQKEIRAIASTHELSANTVK